MATFAFVLEDHVKEDGKQAISLRVTIDRRPRKKGVGYYVKAKDWDFKRLRVKASNPNHVQLNDLLDNLLSQVEKVALEMERIGKPRSEDVLGKLFTTHDFYEWADDYIATLPRGTRNKYTSNVEAIKRFAGDTLSVEHIDGSFVKRYKSWLENQTTGIGANEKPLSRNTITGRMSALRALYNKHPNRAAPGPFEAGDVGSWRRTRREPLTVDDIAALWNCEVRTPTELRAKDMFLLSYYAAGMRIGDVVRLQWRQIREDRIVYSQSKKEHLDADASLDIPLNSFSREILGRRKRGGLYVFGELEGLTDGDQISARVDSIESDINKVLKILAGRCGIDKWIAGSLARRTFADIANKKSKRNVYGIKQAMGHAAIDTTELYLGDDQSAIDELLAQVYED